jgi:hypothetical protein
MEPLSFYFFKKEQKDKKIKRVFSHWLVAIRTNALRKN